jgi:hypothetical protein
MELTKEIKDLINQFLKNDNMFNKQLKSTDFDKGTSEEVGKKIAELYVIAGSAVDHWTKLKIELSKVRDGIFKIDKNNHYIKTLINIRDCKTYKSVEYFHNAYRLINKNNPNILQRTYDWTSLGRHELRDEFNDLFDPLSYFENKLKIRPLLNSKYIPKKLESYFKEIIDTYSLDLDYAYIALCRAVLEMCISDKLKSLPITETLRDDLIKNDCLQKRINLAKKYKILNPDMKSLAHQIRKDANKALHITAKSNSSNMDSKIAGNIVTLVEYLYN